MPPLGPIRFLTIHCAATPEGRDVAAETISSWDTAKFGQVSYHYVIELDGSVHATLPDTLKGAHVGGRNTGNLGVCYVGGVDKAGRPKDTRTPAQTMALRALVAAYRARFPDLVVRGHRDWPGWPRPARASTWPRGWRRPRGARVMLEMLIPLLSRWKWGLALAGLLAFTGLGAAALHYRAALRIERAGRAADRASYVAAQAEATRLSAEAIHHQEAVYRMKAAQQDTAHEADLSAARAAGAAYADAHRLRGQALAVRPAQPLPPPRLTLPDFAKACPPLVSWYPTRTCKPAPK
jgi:hypothetical protein